jgi:two-component system, OmpR family, phosphate regulon sensor histidine kinase PhoR
MKPMYVFYLLVFYIFLQFCWWAYLLVDLNKEIYELKTQHIELTSGDTFVEKESPSLHKQLEKRWIMIAGEGVVFLALLTIGIVMTKKAFHKEVEVTRQQKNFLLSVTHEFKSPIAALQLNIQTILKRDLPPNLQLDFLNNALADTNRLNYLVENVLTATLIDKKNYHLHKEPVDLSKLVEDQVNLLKRFYTGKAEISTSIESGIVCKVDEQAINSIISNLTDNAVKYSSGFANIKIHLKKENDKVLLIVADQGKGIPDEEKVKVFQKFYRIGDEEIRKTKGTGLGLYIVNRIVLAHEGEIKIKDNYPSGTLFEITLK